MLIDSSSWNWLYEKRFTLSLNSIYSSCLVYLKSCSCSCFDWNRINYWQGGFHLLRYRIHRLGSSINIFRFYKLNGFSLKWLGFLCTSPCKTDLLRPQIKTLGCKIMFGRCLVNQISWNHWIESINFSYLKKQKHTESKSKSISWTMYSNFYEQQRNTSSTQRLPKKQEAIKHFPTINIHYYFHTSTKCTISLNKK
jgi:hypothetical protein